MQENGGITTWEAIKELGCTRLSAKIFELKKTHDVRDTWEYGVNRYGDKIKWKRYYIYEEKKDS